MDLTNYTKMSGSFLKAEDVKKNISQPFIIMSEGSMVKSEKFGTERLHLEGTFDGAEKVFDISKTNARFVEKALGPDTKKWIGHLIFFEIYKTKTTTGVMTDALNVIKVQ